MTTEERAVAVIEPQTYNLDKFPESAYNRLIPTQAIVVPSDLIRPVVQVVQLNVEADTYKSNDVPDGHRALNRVGLDKLATTAGIRFVDERRVDDGTNPDVVGVQVTALMLLPTGLPIQATGTRWLDMNRMSWASPAQRNKFRAHVYEHTATRARNRAIRALLSLRSSYPVGELQKPYAVVSFAPNMDHPAVQARVVEQFTPTVGALFGPAGAAQLGAGEAAVKLVGEAEDPDDHAPATPTSLPGEKLAKADPPAEPAWIAATAERPKPDFATSIRDSAAASRLEGPATDAQLTKLTGIFTGVEKAITRAGIVTLFGEAAVAAPTAAQAEAILVAADSLEAAAFAEAWAAMAKARAAA